MPLSGGGISGVELDGPSELPPGCLPVPVMDERDPGQRGVCFGQAVVQRQGPESLLLRATQTVSDGRTAVVHFQRVAVGQAGIGERVLRIARNGGLKVTDGLGRAFRGPLVPREPAHQVEVVRVHIVGVALRHRIGQLAKETDPQYGNNGARQFLLQREDVSHFAIEALGPDQPPVVDVGQLHRNAKAAARSSHRPIEHTFDAEARPDRLPTLGAALEGKDRRARCHLEPADIGQGVDQFLGDAVAQVLGVGLRAGVHEGKHCQRTVIGRSDRPW